MGKIIFIISHKYYRGYESYLLYYIENINKFYNDSLIIVVDNNSKYKNDIFDKINQPNVVLLDNNIQCKFEIGAYKVGIQYLIDNNLIDKYIYCVFTQDTYILKNKYDFDILKTNNIKAASLIGWPNDWAKMDVSQSILEKLGLFNKLSSVNLCWCNSFVLSKDIIYNFYEYIKEIVITIRHQSEASERYLGRILYELNNSINYAIDGEINTFIVNGIEHDCHSVNGYDEMNKYFCKISQQKNERTN